MTDQTSAAESSPAGYDAWFVVALGDLSVIRANEAASHALGTTAGDLPTPLASVVSPTGLRFVRERVVPDLVEGEPWSGTLQLAPSAVDPQPIRVIMVPHVDPAHDGPAEHASVGFTVGERLDAVATNLDPLTGLANRSALFPLLAGAVQRNRLNANLLVVLFIDLDGLKRINDRYGHEVGDAALIEASQRIRSRLPLDVLVVRFGGDEFVVVYEEAREVDEAEALADDILAALHEVDDYHAISASIGIALSRSGEVDPHELIRRADSAMYRAKARGGSQTAIFDADMRSEQLDNEELRSAVLHAVTHNGFGVAAQPILELATGQVRAVELFLRLLGNADSVPDATQLFRLAQEYSEALDAAVLGRAIALAHTWQAALGDSAPRIHINIAAQSLGTSEFARRVGQALRHHRVRPASLAFEVNATDLAVAGERERATIDALGDLGIALVVDGFETGSLSLGSLEDLSPALVKFDAANHSPRVVAAMVRAVSTLGFATCVKSLADTVAVDHAVSIGAFAGQGNGLHPVRSVSRIHRFLNRSGQIGY